MSTIKVTFKEIRDYEDVTLEVYDLPHIAIPNWGDIVIFKKQEFEVMDKVFAPSGVIPKFPQIILRLKRI